MARQSRNSSIEHISGATNMISFSEFRSKFVLMYNEPKRK